MSIYRDYLQPQNIEQALSILVESVGTTAVIAGGTDLLLDMQQGRHADVDLLVDVSVVEEMIRIEVVDDYINIGAAVTHKQIITILAAVKNFVILQEPIRPAF